MGHINVNIKCNDFIVVSEWFLKSRDNQGKDKQNNILLSFSDHLWIPPNV